MTTRRFPLLAGVVALLAALPAAPATTPGCGIVPIGCEAWTATYDGGDDHTQGLIASPDGTRIFVSSIQDTPSARYTAVNAYDAATGARLWNISYLDPSAPEPHKMVLSPDGTQLHVIGAGYVGRTVRMFLITLDAATGHLQWEDHWGTYTEGEDVWSDGATVYAAGMAQNDYAVVAYDAQTGARKWTSSYDNGGGFHTGSWGWSYDSAFEIAHAGANLYVTGLSADEGGVFEYATLALAKATGAQLWVARSQGLDASGSPAESEAYAVKTSTDGSLVYVLGSDGLKALDARTGEPAQAWSGHEDAVRCRTIFPSLREECQLAPTPDGAALLALSQTDLAAYDARTGDLLWHEILHHGPDGGYALTRTMVLAPDGARVYVASGGGREEYVTDGWSDVNYVYETRAFDAEDGRLLWRVTTESSLAPEDIDVSTDGGRVFVTGEDRHRSNVVTVAYDTNLSTFPKPPI